jgi:KDO2-lipid IV(A) lauroyltransferase
MRYRILTKDILLKQKVKIEGLIHVERALRKGKGIILVLPHFGNWELSGVAWAFKGYDLHVFYLDMRLKQVSDMLLKQRRRMGIGLIERSKLKNAIKLLKNNSIVAAISDQDGGVAGVAVPFFGEKVSFPAGSSGLHRMSGATVLPNVLVRQPDDTYIFKILPPIPMEKTKNRGQDEIINSHRIVKVFEEIIKEDPGQWMLSYDRFKFRQHVEDLPELWRDIPECNQ